MKLGTLRNPKFLRLARHMGIGKAAAAGHLEALWAFASEQAPAGDVGRWEDEDIEEACFWEGEPGELIAALVANRWLDECPKYRLIIHEWSQHVSDMVRKRNQRAGVEFAEPHDENPDPPADSLDKSEHKAPAPNGSHPDATRQPDGSRTADHQTPPHPTRPDPTVDRGAEPPPPGGQEGNRIQHDPWDWENPATIPKPDRFRGEAKQRIRDWAARRGHSPRLLNDALEIWEEWTEPVNGKKRRTIKSWVGSFERMVRQEIDKGRLKAETEDERYQRELRESPLSVVNGGRTDG